MGTVLKVIGGLTVLGWIIMGVSCTMLSHAIGKAGGPMTVQSASARTEVVRAMQDGQLDSDGMPSASALRSDDPVTIRLRDGSTRILGASAGERLIRDLLAQRIEAAKDPFSSGSPYGGGRYGSGSYSSRGGTPAEPHFKPGEPMVDPNRSTGSEDE